MAGDPKFCTQCGQGLAPGAKFCSGCGAGVREAAPSAAAQPPRPGLVKELSAGSPPPASEPPEKGNHKKAAGWGLLKKAGLGKEAIEKKAAENKDRLHVAVPRDDSLQALLVSAFQVAEIRFINFDHDRCQALMYTEFKNDVAQSGFYDEARLEGIWRRCDIDRSNMIDFKEFLYMLYLWQYAMDVSGTNSSQSNAPTAGYGQDYIKAKKTQLYGAFFKSPDNRKIVQDAFTKCEQYYMKYDADGNRMLSLPELQNFMTNHLPGLWSFAQKFIPRFYPPNEPGKEIHFMDFLGLLYLCCFDIKRPDGRPVLGRWFEKTCLPGGQPSCFTIDMLKQAFAALENDFSDFDADGNGRLELHEIVEALPKMENARAVAFFAKLQHTMDLADSDRSGDLDFFQFMMLAFHTCLEGSYSELIIKAHRGGAVKRTMMAIHGALTDIDSARKYRFSWEQMSQLYARLFRGHGVPAQARTLYDRFKYISSQTRSEVVDVPRAIQMLYMLLLPDGRFHPARYNPPRKKPTDDDISKFVTLQAGPPEMQEANKIQQALTIDPVDPAQVVKGKMLGQGGQGTAFMATYNGVKVCAKYLNGQVTSQVIKDLLIEVALMKKLSHPNCHHLVGARTSPPIVILTAVCSNNSIFDYYTKKLLPSRKLFHKQTATRLAIECARGLGYLHNLGYMHRDIKSLNVFLDDDMVAKVADFGFTTNDKIRTDPAGTPQWMAPEILNIVVGRRSQYDRSSDVYSYGVMLWELFHCKIPYANFGVDQMSLPHLILAKRVRLDNDRHCPPSVAQLIERCLSADPHARPTFEAILTALE